MADRCSGYGVDWGSIMAANSNASPKTGGSVK